MTEGDLIAFLMDDEGCSFGEVRKILAALKSGPVVAVEVRSCPGWRISRCDPATGFDGAYNVEKVP